MVVDKALRAGAKCKAGDVVDVALERDRERRVVAAPTRLKKVIASNQAAQATWDSLFFTHQKEWRRAILEAKKEETRQSRIKKMMDALKSRHSASDSKRPPAPYKTHSRKRGCAGVVACTSAGQPHFNRVKLATASSKITTTAAQDARG